MQLEQFKELLNTDLKSAMREKDSIKMNTIRSINTAITVSEKSGKLTDHIQILSALAKQRNQSIEIYEKNNNTDLADQEKRELEIINSYLPKQLSENEIQNIITEIISNLNIEIKGSAIGKVMTEFKTNYPGQDMSLVSKTIKNLMV